MLESGKRSRLRVSWILSADSHWSLSRYKTSSLYIFSFSSWVEYFDNYSRPIPLVVPLIFDFFSVFPKWQFLPPTSVLLINSFPSTFSAWFSPTSDQKEIFFSFPDEVSNRQIVTVSPRYFILDFKKKNIIRNFIVSQLNWMSWSTGFEHRTGLASLFRLTVFYFIFFLACTKQNNTFLTFSFSSK